MSFAYLRLSAWLCSFVPFIFLVSDRGDNAPIPAKWRQLGLWICFILIYTDLIERTERLTSRMSLNLFASSLRRIRQLADALLLIMGFTSRMPSASDSFKCNFVSFSIRYATIKTILGTTGSSGECCDWNVTHFLTTLTHAIAANICFPVATVSS